DFVGVAVVAVDTIFRESYLSVGKVLYDHPAIGGRTGDVVIGIVPGHDIYVMLVGGDISIGDGNAVAAHETEHAKDIQHGFVDPIGRQIAEAVEPALTFEFE